MLNKVSLIGRLGSDPEIKYTGEGRPVANLSLATDESYKNAQGEKVKKVEWHRLVAWDKTAEIMQQYLHKGDLIYVEGKLQSRSYESEKDGQTHTVFEIVVRDMKMLNTRGEETPAAAPVRTAPATRAMPPKARIPQSVPATRPRLAPRPVQPVPTTPIPAQSQEITDEDIPF